jgi:hypothetical protein
VQAAHRLITTAHDSDEDYDVSHPRGLPVDTEHPGNIGAFLAHPVGGYPRNTELNTRVLKDLRNKGHAQILVRSPLVGGPRDGGVYSRDVGRREKGSHWLPSAIMSATPRPRPSRSRSARDNSARKHTGGIVGAAGAAAVSGFKYINQMVNVPQKATTWAAHAQHDGRVANVAEAPQGGHYIYVDGHKHYVFPGQKPTVKAGDGRGRRSALQRHR